LPLAYRICIAAVVRRAPFGVTDGQRDDAYSQWIQGGLILLLHQTFNSSLPDIEAIQQGLKGAVQYQVRML
jgi:hypothetical protein